ncbi:MerR family transcriptional regulator [Corynebacterium pilosum]|nr:MerR family transcriptional regulator [Corynebacterium pilosum]
MANLSELSGIGVSTIKFYLREGLLHPGVRTQANQARYDNGHLARLQLIRALSDVGRLSLAEIGKVLRVFDQGGSPIQGLATLRENSTAECGREESERQASISLDSLCERLGWNVSKSSPAYRAAVHSLGALAMVDGELPEDTQLEAFAQAAETVVDNDNASRRSVCSDTADVETGDCDYHRLLVGAMRRDQLLAALALLATESKLAG